MGDGKLNSTERSVGFFRLRSGLLVFGHDEPWWQTMTTHMKKKIKSVSIDLFHRKGYFATGVSDIARGCGIQKASIYHHYSTKEEILFYILTSTLADLESVFSETIARIVGTEAKLRATIRSHILFHIDRQKEVIIADSELRGLSPKNRKIVIHLRDRYESGMQALIRQGMDKGLWEEGDEKILSYAVLTTCTAVATWFKSKGRLPKDEIIGIYETFILNGLKGSVRD
jgi:AcrR family transcriptional regulator